MINKLKKIFSIIAILATLAMFFPPLPANAASTPPENFFKFPFPRGRWWRMTGGPHQWNQDVGGKPGDPLTSLDFAPVGHSGCGAVDSRDYVAAAADGKVVVSSSTTVRIDHLNGWYTEYFHLAGVKVKVNDTVKQGQELGFPSCSGGATGAHVHFSLLRADSSKPNGWYYSIIGTTVEGWKIEDASSPYTGCLKSKVTKQLVCQQLSAVSSPTYQNAFRSMRSVIYIKSIYSGLAISINKTTIPNMDTNIVIQNKWKNISEQKWYLVPFFGENAGYYELMSVYDPSMCLDIAWGYQENGATVQIFTCNSTDSQKFKFVQVPGEASSTMYIQTKFSERVLQLKDQVKIPAPLTQWDQSTQPSQYWIAKLEGS